MPELKEENHHPKDGEHIEERESPIAPAPGPLIPKPGERCLIAGQTGSGKTQLTVWVTERLEDAPAIIIDTKEEPKYERLPYSVVAETQEQVNTAIDGGEADYIIFRPPIQMAADPKQLDDLLMYHYLNYQGMPIVIDELFSVHINGRAGPGLIALLTRGRSRRITTVMGCQRPTRFDRFAITEAQKIFAFRFADREDRRRLGDVIPGFVDLPLPPKFGFYFFEVGEDHPILYDPIPLDPDIDAGYTDNSHEAEASAEAVRKSVFF